MTLTLPTINSSQQSGRSPIGSPEMGRPIDELFGSYYVEDEQDLTGVEILGVNVNFLPSNFRQDDLKYLQDSYEEMSVSCGLEVGSKRTQAIEERLVSIGDRLGHDAEGLRVVIMNRGLVPNAFVTPDKTIFISQSIIDALGSVDELMGIAIHEARHLTNKTYEWKREMGIKAIGVPWLHEIVSDQATRDDLEAMGLNSLGLRTAFKNLTEFLGEGPDSVHMADLRRRTQLLGAMKVSHSSTSGSDLTPLSIHLKHPDGNPEITALPTNIETFKIAADSEDYKALGKILPNLSRKDFKDTYFYRSNCGAQKTVKNNYGIEVKVTTSHEEKSLRISALLDELLSERLRERDCSEDEILLYRIGLYDQLVHPCNTFPMPDGISISQFVERNKDFVFGERAKELSQEIFDYEYGSGFHTLFKIINLIRDSRDTVYDPDWGISVDEQELIALCKVISEWVYEYRDDKDDHKAKVLTTINGSLIVRYANGWLSKYENGEIDPRYKDFIKEVAGSGIQVDKDSLIRDLEDFRRDSIRGRGHFYLGPKELPESHAYGSILATMLKEFFDFELPVPEKREKVIPEVTFERIDKDFQTFNIIPEYPHEYGARATPEESEPYQKAVRFQKLMRDLARHLGERERADDTRRLEYARYLSAKIDELDFERKEMWYEGDYAQYKGAHIMETLRGEGSGKSAVSEDEGRFPDDDVVELAKQTKFNLKLAVAVSAFDKDSPEFYEFVSEVMKTSGIDVTVLSDIEIINMCHPLLGFNKSGELLFARVYAFQSYNTTYFAAEGKEDPSKCIKYNDISAMESLPFVKELLSRRTRLQAMSFPEIVEYVDVTFNRYIFGRSFASQDIGVFNELPISIILGEPVANRLEELIVQNSVPEVEYDQLYELLNKLYPRSAEKSEILKGIRINYLNSANVPLERRVEFLLNNSHQLGVEGIVALAERIDRFDEFVDFEDRVGEKAIGEIGGSRDITILAASDFVGSMIKGKSERLMRTAMTDEATSAEVTTGAVIEWAKNFMTPVNFSRESSAGYDYENERFIFGSIGRSAFVTPKEGIRELQGLGFMQRFYAAEKSLTDYDGALQTEESRKRLSSDIQRSLELEKSFFGMLLDEMTKQADPSGETADVYALMASGFIAPALFRGLDISKVDYERVLDEVEFTNYKDELYWRDDRKVKLRDLISAEELERIVTGNSHELLSVGTVYKDSQDSEFFARAQSINEIYIATIDRLFDQFGDRTSEKNKKKDDSTLPENVEAIISGAEHGGGIVVIRAMQQLPMMKRLSAPLYERLSQTFDANEGLEKARFWHNLRRHSKRDIGLEQYLTQKLVRVGKKIGGGSMATTYECTVLDDEGREAEAVIRMLVPNPELEISEVSKVFNGGLKAVEERPKQPGESRKEYIERVNNARLGLSMTNMCEGWCREDVTEKDYENLDDEYRTTTVADFNNQKGRIAVEVPGRLFTSKMVRIERKAKGRSIREFMEDDSVPDSLKTEGKELYKEFVGFQFNGNYSTKDRLVHADPTPGNYFISFDEQDRPVLYVLDRGMPLRRGESEMDVLYSLENGKYLDFVRGLVISILEFNRKEDESINEYLNKIKLKVGGLIIRSLLQRADQATMVTGILEVLASEGYKIPHKLQLLLRNKVSYETVL